MWSIGGVLRWVFLWGPFLFSDSLARERGFKSRRPADFLEKRTGQPRGARVKGESKKNYSLKS